MKTLTQHISQVKTLHSLNEFINEKLIVNKNYKNVDDIEELFGNIDFKYDDRYTIVTSDDIFSIMVNYIRNHNIRSFSDFDSYKKTSQEDGKACLAVFNKHIKEIDIFQKISNDNYKVFVIFKLSYVDRYMFSSGERSFILMHVLRNCDTWNNTDEVKYYEISKETFDDISELHNKLIKK